MRRVSFHRLAERELNDAARQFDLESPGLGRAFLDAVEKTCASILEHPHSGVSVVGAIRRRLIRRFPYALLYSVRSGNIRVLAVMNLKRRPNCRGGAENGVFLKRIDGSGEARVLFSATSPTQTIYPTSFSGDGSILLIDRGTPDGFRLDALRLGENAEPVPLLTGSMFGRLLRT